MMSLFDHRALIWLAIVSVILSVTPASVQTSAFTYQGKLSDGASPANGDYDMQFNLFDTATVGTGVRKGPAITNPSVPVTAGVFTVQLDFGLVAFNGQPRYLEIGVRPYVQNTTSQQAASNFNISGDGTASGTLSGAVVNASTQFNIAGGRVLSVGGTANLFAGFNSGTNNTGSNNSFFGPAAGAQNTTGGSNSYFGTQAGALSATGGNNAFFGYRAGFANTASDNAFFGSGAGEISVGDRNSFFGARAGNQNTTGIENAFFGYNAGTLNTASNNSFFGSGTGEKNTTGVNNSFFGYHAGSLNVSGGWNSFFGLSAGSLTTAANSNSFFGAFAGLFNTTGANNVFIGYEAAAANFEGSYNTIIGHTANLNSSNLNHATAIGAESVVTSSNTIALGRRDGSDLVEIYGRLQLDTLGPATTNLCFNSANRIGICSSSLRYKTAVQPFMGGLDIVRRLRPITFNWIDGGLRDVGFGAEEVEKIAPLLTTLNAKGEIEGVKYGQITTVLVNAIQQQQAQIAGQQRSIVQQQRQNQALQTQIRRQQQQLEALRKLVCLSHRRADVCR
jgi:hypothetical protein